MDRSTIHAVLFAAAVSGIAGSASAGYADRDEGLLFARNASSVTIELIERRAGWNGELSVINVDAESVEDQTSFLLSNRGHDRNRIVDVGTFDAGEAILFQYEVVSGQRNIFRMDDEAGLRQFRHEWLDADTARLYVEDIKLPGGNKDYNDAVYELNFSAVPTPGALGVAAAGLALVARRRRG